MITPPLQSSLTKAVSKAVSEPVIGIPGVTFPLEAYVLKLENDVFANPAIDPTVTLARNSVKMIVDHEGLMKEILVGEVGFDGLRRVENAFVLSGGVTSTDDFDNWNTIGTNVSGNVITPTGSINDRIFFSNVGEGDSGLDYIYHLKVTPSVDNQVIRILLDQVAGSITFVDVTLPSAGVEYWVCSDVHTPNLAATDVRIIIYPDRTNGTATLRVHDGQLEDVTGQSDQSPADYVSKGIIGASPYHGVLVDGVRYEKTKNGNIVTNNIVTPGNGAALRSRGFRRDPLATNECTRNTSISQANVGWSVIQPGTIEVVDDAVGILGTKTASKYECSGFNSDGIRFQLAGAASTDYCISAFVRPSAEGQKSRFGILDSGGAGWEHYRDFEWISGVPVDDGTGTGVGTNQNFGVDGPYVGGFYRIWVACTTDSVHGGNFQAHLQVDRGAVAGRFIHTEGWQIENSLYPTGLIITGPSPVVRQKDVLEIDPSNLIDLEGTIYCEVEPFVSADLLSGGIVTFVQSASTILFFGSPGNVQSSDGSKSINFNDGQPYSGVLKVGLYWETSANFEIILNGAQDTSAVNSYDGPLKGGNLWLGIGNDGGWWIKNLRIWHTPLTVDQLKALM